MLRSIVFLALAGSGVYLLAIGIRALAAAARTSIIPARATSYARLQQPRMFWVCVLTWLLLLMPLGLLMIVIAAHAIWWGPPG